MTEKGKYRVCGALAGTVNGLFGGGGGIPLAFLLRSWAKLSDKTALATCVAVIFPFCLVSVLVYAFRGALPLGRRSLPCRRACRRMDRRQALQGRAEHMAQAHFRAVSALWRGEVPSVTDWLFPALCGLLTGILSSGASAAGHCFFYA